MGFSKRQSSRIRQKGVRDLNVIRQQLLRNAAHVQLRHYHIGHVGLLNKRVVCCDVIGFGSNWNK